MGCGRDDMFDNKSKCGFFYSFYLFLFYFFFIFFYLSVF